MNEYIIYNSVLNGKMHSRLHTLLERPNTLDQCNLSISQFDMSCAHAHWVGSLIPLSCATNSIANTQLTIVDL